MILHDLYMAMILHDQEWVLFCLGQTKPQDHLNQQQLLCKQRHPCNQNRHHNNQSRHQNHHHHNHHVQHHFCQVGMNFFMMLDFSDPADQLAWLVEQLRQSEEAGEVK